MLALVGPSPLQAQPRSEDGPSVDQLMEVLPQTLPAMERTRARQSDPSAVTGVYENTGNGGPPRVDVRVMHGQRGVMQAQKFAQRPSADTTTAMNGRTLYSGVIERGNPEGVVLWISMPTTYGSAIQRTTPSGLPFSMTPLYRARPSMAVVVSAEGRWANFWACITPLCPCMTRTSTRGGPPFPVFS